MRIAIVGAGNVGTALGQSLGRAGHNVVFAERGAAQEAVRDADAVILAVPFKALKDAVSGVELKGKLVIDATNAVGVAIPEGMSGAEQLARWIPGAHVVKCFNQTGAEIMGQSAFPVGRAVMFAAGDNLDARKKALSLASDAGFEALDAGPLANARHLESLALLWIHLAFQAGQGRGFAFSVLRR